MKQCRMMYEKQTNPTVDWLNIGVMIAKENGIDELGMPDKHLKILQAVYKRPVSRDRLANILNIRVKELTEFIVPWLIAESQECPALISVSTSGFKLTKAGYNELKKRKLADCLPKYLEEEAVEEDIHLELAETQDDSDKNALKSIAKTVADHVDNHLEVIPEPENKTILKKVEKAIKDFVQTEILQVGVNVGMKVLMEAAKRVL